MDESSELAGNNFMPAFRLLLAILLAHTLWYVAYQNIRDPQLPWEDTEIVFLDTTLDARLVFDRRILNRVISESKVDRWIEEVEEVMAPHLDQITSYRCVTSTSVSHFLKRRANNSSLDLYVTGCNAVSSETSSFPSSIEIFGDVIENLNISTLSYEAKSEFDELIELIDQLEEKENQSFNAIRAKLKTLEPDVSFAWLYHEDSGWIIELVAWAIFGVLISSLSWLINQLRQGSYDNSIFLLFVPRLFLAPILATVITAFIVSGESSFDISLENLPLFLCFSFIMGFNSESLTRLVRNIFNRLFSDNESASEVEKSPRSFPQDDSPAKPIAKNLSLLDRWEASVRNKANTYINETFGDT